MQWKWVQIYCFEQIAWEIGGEMFIFIWLASLLLSLFCVLHWVVFPFRIKYLKYIVFFLCCCFFPAWFGHTFCYIYSFQSDHQKAQCYVWFSSTSQRNEKWDGESDHVVFTTLLGKYSLFTDPLGIRFHLL